MRFNQEPVIPYNFYTFASDFTYSTQGVAKVYPRCSQGQKADITLSKAMEVRGKSMARIKGRFSDPLRRT